MLLKEGLISLQDLSKEELLKLLDEAEKMKCDPDRTLPLKGKLMASCFFEPSTRTRLSFEAAMKSLGGDVIGFDSAQNTSTAKKETLYDSIKVIGQYADLIVMRHSLEGAARLASEATDRPVINAGDGKNQHPTQTLTDLFTIRETQGTLDGLRIAFLGDLLQGRAVQTLILAASLFSMRLYFISLPGLELPSYIKDILKKRGVLFSFHEKVEEVLPKLDILYITRVQEERAVRPFDNANYCLQPEMFENPKENLKILHPLPRVKEIPRAIDPLPFAHYFEQAENGLHVRKALLKRVCLEA